MKRCSDCGVEKEAAEFYASSRSSKCKICSRLRTRKWHRANREKANLSRRRRWAAISEKVNPLRRQRRLSSPHGGRESTRRWKAKNPEKNRAAAKCWHDKNRSSIAALHRRWRESLRDSYVKQLLVDGTSLSSKDIPASMVELKRVLLMIHRHKKQQTPGEYGNTEKH